VKSEVSVVRQSETSRAGAGLALAIFSAATFGTSGTFASSLLKIGWTPATAVTVRIGIAALVLTIPALLELRGRWAELRRALPMVAMFGLVAVAACQLFYFNAVEHLSVGVALLLEYLGTVLVVGWLWLRHGQRPRRLTLVGALVSILGLVLVLNLIGTHHLDPVGVLWGLAAAAGLAVFFVLSARVDDGVPPLVMAWGAMTIGAITLIVFDAVGLLKVHAVFHDVRLAGHQTSWLVPVLGLSVVAAAIAYLAGIGASRMLGAKLASFVGLTEVLCAVLFAWLLLGQAPTAIQFVGGALIIAGVAIVRIDELSAPSGDRAPALDQEVQLAAQTVAQPATSAS
jgi:drug/metabolite transporter (DMT)-like permease